MRWVLKQSDPVKIKQLAATAKVPRLVAQLLLDRGIDSPEAVRDFLNPQVAHLHAPELMLGLVGAVDRLQSAIAKHEPMLIYGDYDVDGTTAVVILKTAIEICGGSVDFHVPHRIREGYGMKDDVIERAAAAGVRLIISVDTGIRAFAAAETAARLNVDLIVTDHHLPDIGEGVPRALAVLNPNQPGCGYPCKSLCGAGVAFKLGIALIARIKGATEAQRLLPSFLKMVAIATIADAVPLTGENRVFTKLGLQELKRVSNPGLKALFDLAKVGDARKGLTASEVGFRIAPRLNAAGRMDIAQDVIELFTTRDAQRARELAAKLNQLNTDRQQEEQKIIAAMLERVEADAAIRDAYCLVVDGEGWHRGVIGICATRLVERYGKPALVISRDGEHAHGSGRSIAGFHLLDALEDATCKPLFARYGGHAHAVGFGLLSENVPALRAALDRYARARLTPDDFAPAIAIDAELPLDQVNDELAAAIKMLEPFGQGNPEPRFGSKGVRLAAPPKILKEKHLKFRVSASANGSRRFDLMAWRMAEQLAGLNLVEGDLVDIAFRLDENEHPDFGGLQLVLADLRRGQAESA